MMEKQPWKQDLVYRGSKPRRQCKFFDLPSELRVKIYAMVLLAPRQKRVVRRIKNRDQQGQPTQPTTRASRRRTNILLVSRRFHDDATQYLYSAYTFRIFHMQEDFSRLPTVADIPLKYKKSVKAIRLVLGSSWTRIPASWVVNEELGLNQMDLVHTLEVFVLCDPSHPTFEGFRVSKDYYTLFAGRLLREILDDLPKLTRVVFDGYQSVQRHGGLMTRLVEEVQLAEKKIGWTGRFATTAEDLTKG